MQSKVSAKKNFISINLGSIMERDEKRFEYRLCCSSEENNVEEDNEGGIGAVVTTRYGFFLSSFVLRVSI